MVFMLETLMAFGVWRLAFGVDAGVAGGIWRFVKLETLVVFGVWC